MLFYVYKVVNGFKLLFIRPWPQNAHAVHRCDRWRQVSADALDVDVELSALHTLNDRDPNDTYDDHETHKRPMEPK